LSDDAGQDPYFERVNDGNGSESQVPFGDSRLEKEREEAQGVEVFEDPDDTIPRTRLVEGSPGQESLSAESPDPDLDDDRREVNRG
jgi:hypothetical protein